MSSTPPPPPDLNEILEAAADTYYRIVLTRYACAIGTVILCYDSSLTFADEVRLIWGSKWSTTKFLLYFNRILAFFSLLSNTWHSAGFHLDLDSTTCEGILFATGYAAILSFCIANWILLLRVSALYGHNRTIFWGLAIFWFLSYAATLTMMGLTVKALHGVITYSTLFNICVIPHMPSVLPVVWMSPIAFEVTTFSMSIYKTWSHARANDDLGSSPLMHVLYRDGVMYFVVIMGMRIFNLICWLVFPVSLMFVGVFILWALIIIMINRLFLNLRGLHISDQEENHSTKPGKGPQGTHTPVFSHRARGTNIFRGGTMISDEELPINDPTRSIGMVGIQVNRKDERRSSPLLDQWPDSPMPDKAHCLTHFLPCDAPSFNQTQIQAPITAATPLICTSEGSVSPQAALNLGTTAACLSKATDRALECSYDVETASTRTKRVLTKRVTETDGGHFPLSRLRSYDP